jgi:hypothetical protein
MPDPDATASGALLDLDNPWPGLESYDESAHEYFSGRSMESDELFRRIVDEPTTVLFGKSGLGKTSLLRAGVFPRLRDKGLLPIFIRLQFRPDTAPLIEQVSLALLDELQARQIEHAPPAPGETLWEYLHGTGREFWTRQNRLVSPVFVFDQFEELFTLGRAVPGAVAAFREDLADLAENRLPASLAARLENQSAAELGFDVQAMSYKLVVSFREDFLADLESWRLTMPSLRRNRMRLLPLRAAAAFEAVCNARTKHLVSEELAPTIVAFLSSGTTAAVDDDEGATVEPALLSLFCRGVNEHRKQAGKTRFDEALLEGAKETIVADFYLSSLVDQPERVRRFIAEELITEHGFRNSYSVDDAIARGFVTAAELQALIDRHLLRKEHHLGIERVELTHDLLTRAVVDEREERRRVERSEREQRARRRLWAVTAICISLTLVFLWLTWDARSARNQADQARDRSRSRELGALAAATLRRDPALAVAFALEGLRRADTAEARSALLEAAQYAWPVTVLTKDTLGGAPTAIALSPDGRWAAIALEQQVAVWDVTSQPPSRRWAAPMPAPKSLAFSPDQTRLAVGREGFIEIVDADTGGRPRQVPQPSVTEPRVSFSPDGTWLAWNRNGDGIMLLDHRDERAGPVEIAVEGVVGFAVLGDGRRIMVVTDPPLSAHVRERQLDGSWTLVKLSFKACRTPQSVSPGATVSSVSWKARTCLAGPDAREFADRNGRDNLRETSDIVWSAGGRAAAELLVPQDAAVQDVVVARYGRTTPLLKSQIKGVDSLEDVNDKSRLISTDELGTRTAVVGQDPVTKVDRVTVYSVSDHKPFLSRLRLGSFAVAPDGRSLAIARPAGPSATGAVIDVIELDRDFVSGAGPRLGRRLELPILPDRIHASQSSIVAVLTKPKTIVVFEAATGKPRFELQTEDVQPLGAARELLLVKSVTGERIVKTSDGTTVAPWEPAPPGASAAVLRPSANGEAVAVLRTRAGGPPTVSAEVYAVQGNALVLAGRVVDMPESVGWGSIELAPSDDARTLLEVHRASRDRHKLTTTVWPVTSGTDAARAQPAPPVESRDDVAMPPARSPRGQFEMLAESGATSTATVRLVRRADQSIVKRFEGGLRHMFASDDRWLVSWSDKTIQVLDLARGEVAFVLADLGNVDAVRYAPGNTILEAHFDGEPAESMLVPLDPGLMERFARWLMTRQPTRQERCMYGLAAEADCRDEVVTRRSSGPAVGDKAAKPGP